MSILVIAEHDNAGLKAATLNAVTAAAEIGARLGTDIHVLVAGADCGTVAEHAARIQGVTRVKLADAAHYGDQTAENLAALAFATLDAVYLDHYGNQLRLERVRLYETPNCWADASRQDVAGS